MQFTSRDTSPRLHLAALSAFLVLSLAPAASVLSASGPARAENPQDFEVVPNVAHDQNTIALTYGPDGRWLTSTAFDGTIRLWLDSRLRHVVPGRLAAMTPDGARVVTVEATPYPPTDRLRVWSLESGEQLWEAVTPRVLALAVSPDASRILTGCHNSEVRVWGLDSGRQLHLFRAPGKHLGQLAVGSQGAVATSHQAEIAIWEARHGHVECRMQGHESSVSALAFAPDDATLASADRVGGVRIWDPATCETRRELDTGGRRVDHLDFSDDGALLFAAGPGSVWLWESATGRPLELPRIAGQHVSATALTPRGDRIALGHLQGQILVAKPDSDQPPRTLHSGFGLHRLALSPDGTQLAASHRGLDVFDLATGDRVRVPDHRRLHVTALHLSQDAAQVVTESLDATRIWNLLSGRPPIELTGPRALASRDGSVVAIGDQDHELGELEGVKIWLRESRRVHHEATHEVGVSTFALDQDGALLATGAHDGTVRLWSAKTGELRQQMRGPASVVYGLAWIEDERAVVAGYPDGSLWVWNVGEILPRQVLYHPEKARTWQMFAVPSTSWVLTKMTNGGTYLWDLHRGEIRSRIFHRNHTLEAFAHDAFGRIVLAASDRRPASVWDLESGRSLLELRGQSASVEAVAVFDRGRRIATGARDGTLALWDAGEGRLRQLRPLAPAGITAIAVSAGATFLATGDRDGTVTFWQTESGAEIARIVSNPGGGWAVVSPDGRWDAPDGGHDPGLTAWSGLRPGLLADHPDRKVSGLLAKTLEPFVESDRRASREARERAEASETPRVAGSPKRPRPAIARQPVPPRPPSLRDLEPSPAGLLRPVLVKRLPAPRHSIFFADGRQAVLLRGGRPSRLRLFDLSDPSHPATAAELEVAGHVTALDFWRGFLYVADHHRLTVIDVTELERSREVSHLEIASVADVDVDDGFAFLAQECDGLSILDLEAPERPRLLATLADEALGCLKTVTVRGRYAYAAGASVQQDDADSFLQVFDVSDPAEPRPLGRSVYSQSGRRDLGALAVEGDHAYLAAGDLGLLIYDVSDPSAPEQVARVDLPSLADVAVLAGRAYLADFFLGLQILDVEEPAAPWYLGGSLQAPVTGRGPNRVALSGAHAGEFVLVGGSRGVEIFRCERRD